MSQQFYKFTFPFSWLVSFSVLSVAFWLQSPASAQGIGADFSGGKEKLEAGALVVYGLLAVLLTVSFAIAIAHFARVKIANNRANAYWEGTEED